MSQLTAQWWETWRRSRSESLIFASSVTKEQTMLGDEELVNSIIHSFHTSNKILLPFTITDNERIAAYSPSLYNIYNDVWRQNDVNWRWRSCFATTPPTKCFCQFNLHNWTEYYFSLYCNERSGSAFIIIAYRCIKSLWILMGSSTTQDENCNIFDGFSV